MTFHGGGFNSTQKERRAVNHLFNIPYFKQQINLPRAMDAASLTDAEREMLGFVYQEPGSIEDYLAARSGK
jgi:ectoine hydroxylase-related dioxygenase (phytanoyl-CoA dioxygenase family)